MLDHAADVLSYTHPQNWSVRSIPLGGQCDVRDRRQRDVAGSVRRCPLERYNIGMIW